MKAAERRSQISKLLNVQKRVQVSELADLFNVSMETIRRDLDFLESESIVVKVHGGAIRKTDISSKDYFFNARLAQNISEKQAIAQTAAAYIEDNDIIALDTGSTILQLSQYISDLNISIITASLPVLNALSNYDISHMHGKILFLGGEFNENSLSTYGELALAMLDTLSISKLFFSCDAFDANGNIYYHNMREGLLTKKFLEKAKSAYLLLDSSKINSESFYCIASANRIDKIISSAPCPNNFSSIAPHSEWIIV